MNNGQFRREYQSLSKLFSAQEKSFSDDYSEKLGNTKPHVSLGGLVRPLSALPSANPHMWMVCSGAGIREKIPEAQQMRHVVLIVCSTHYHVHI